APPGLPFRFDPSTIAAGLNFTLTTSSGSLDLFGEVTGGGTYEDLQPECVKARLLGLDVQVLGIPALVRIKRALGRPKDLEPIAELEALLEERQRLERENAAGG
ncbi:MAG: hypothetical protein ACRD0X_07415, partial [Thermoanaerobaculia bacterium]